MSVSCDPSTLKKAVVNIGAVTQNNVDTVFSQNVYFYQYIFLKLLTQYLT